MADKVLVRQNDKFEISFQAADPQEPNGELEPIAHLYALTPHGMLLASLAACTTILLHSYAQHHNIDLPWVEIEAIYQHPSDEEFESEQEQIVKTLMLPDDLDDAMRERLHKISHRCSIQEVLENGISIQSRLGS
jgi:putative redox protein